MGRIEYKELIVELSNKFRNTIPEDEDRMTKEFENYLVVSIEELENSDNIFIEKDRATIEAGVRAVAQYLIDADLKIKKQELLVDKNFEEIRKISSQIYNLAKEVLQGNSIVLEFEATKKIQELEKLLSAVEDYNKERAKQLVSETILDLNYISEPKTKISSLRLAHLRSNNIRENDGEER